MIGTHAMPRAQQGTSAGLAIDEMNVAIEVISSGEATIVSHQIFASLNAPDVSKVSGRTVTRSRTVCFSDGNCRPTWASADGHINKRAVNSAQLARQLSLVG